MIQRTSVFIVLILLTVGCAGMSGWRVVDFVSYPTYLEIRHGHTNDVLRPGETPRNTTWINEELKLSLRVARYLHQHPSIPLPVATILQRKAMQPGLTKEQVLLLWGPPDEMSPAGHGGYYWGGKWEKAHGRLWTQQPGDEVWHYTFRLSSLHVHRYALFFREGLLELITMPDNPHEDAP